MSALEFLTGFITISDDPIWNWVLGAILLTVSGSVAYAIGHRLNYHGKSGWWLWLITAIAVYAVIACVIRAVMWLVALPWGVWAIAGGVITAAMIITACFLFRRKARERNEVRDQGTY